MSTPHPYHKLRDAQFKKECYAVPTKDCDAVADVEGCTGCPVWRSFVARVEARSPVLVSKE